MLFCADDCAEAPVTEPAGLIVGVDQVYVVPVGTTSPEVLVGEIVNVEPLHIVVVFEDIAAFGFTVTWATFEVITPHPPDSEGKVIIQ